MDHGMGINRTLKSERMELIVQIEEAQDILPGPMTRRQFQKAVKKATADARVAAFGPVLAKHKGNVIAAAKELQITPQYLYLIIRTEFPKGALEKYKQGLDPIPAATVANI